ncbi:MAG: oligosaccharide flippase family protein, partial [Clostridiaceae bacterium]|nr:oligosaccharide flippase family protein [Clostridiaceae bacterium]
MTERDIKENVTAAPTVPPPRIGSLRDNAIYKTILNVFNLLIPLLVTPHITGLLTAESYGLYNRAFNEFQYFFILGACGIYAYGVREMSRVRNDRAAVSRVLTSLFVISVGTNFIATVLYVGFFLLRSAPGEASVYAVFIIQMLSNVFYLEFANEAMENYRFITLKTILVRLLYLGSIFLFVRRPGDLIPYAMVISLTVLLNNLISYVYLRRRLPFAWRNIEVRRHIKPLLVALLLTNVEMLFAQSDKTILAPFVGDISVTEYNVPYTLAGSIASVPLAMATVATPRLANLIGEKKHDEYSSTLNSAVESYMVLMVPIAFGLAVLAPEIMEYFTKGKYAYVWPIMAVTSLSRIVYAYQIIMSHLILYVNRMEKQLTLMLLICGVINVGVDLALAVLGVATPISLMLTTIGAILLFVVIGKIYTTRRGMRYRLITPRVAGYVLPSLLFIPIAYGIRSLALG